MASTRQKRSKVWLYFTPKDEARNTCNTCKVSISSKGGNTSNMLKHLSTQHAIHLQKCSMLDTLLGDTWESSGRANTRASSRSGSRGGATHVLPLQTKVSEDESDGGGQTSGNTSPQNNANTQGRIKEESTDMMMSTGADSPHTVLVKYKFENPGLDVTPPDHDTAHLEAMEPRTWVPEAIKASDNPQFSGMDLDAMDLDQLKREKIKMQLKVLKLQEEYFTLQIKKLKQ